MTTKSYEHQYLDLLRRIRDEGENNDDRTGVGTRGIMGAQMRYDLREGFPLLQTKRVPLGIVATELCWMLQGRRDLRYLVERGCNIWNEWPFTNYLRATKMCIRDRFFGCSSSSTAIRSASISLGGTKNVGTGSFVIIASLYHKLYYLSIFCVDRNICGCLLYTSRCV